MLTVPVSSEIIPKTLHGSQPKWIPKPVPRNAFRILMSIRRSFEDYEKQSHFRLGVHVLNMYRLTLLKK